MTTMASEITSLTVVYSTVYSNADQRKHQSSASLAFVWGIHRDRWIPRTKGQLRGKCFHLMTSSWCMKTTAVFTASVKGCSVRDVLLLMRITLNASSLTLCFLDQNVLMGFMTIQTRLLIWQWLIGYLNKMSMTPANNQSHVSQPEIMDIDGDVRRQDGHVTSVGSTYHRA